MMKHLCMSVFFLVTTAWMRDSRGDKYINVCSKKITFQYCFNMLSYDTTCGNRARKLKQNHVRLLMMTGSVISHEYSAFNIVMVLFHSLFLYSSINTRIRQVLSLESSLLSEFDML